MRTFIALELPSDFITNIAQIEQDLQSSIQGHFVTENSLHLSLAFMGELKTNAQLSATQYRCILKGWVYLVALLMQHSGWASPPPRHSCI